MTVLFSPHVLTPSEGISDGVRTSPRGPSLSIILLLLLSPLLHQSSLDLTLVGSLGLMFPFLSLGSLIILFVSFYVVQGSPSSCLFFFRGHILHPDIAHKHSLLSDSLSLRGSRGCLRVRDWRTFAV